MNEKRAVKVFNLLSRDSDRRTCSNRSHGEAIDAPAYEPGQTSHCALLLPLDHGACGAEGARRWCHALAEVKKPEGITVPATRDDQTKQLPATPIPVHAFISSGKPVCTQQACQQ
jgi:hypothetical protein